MQSVPRVTGVESLSKRQREILSRVCINDESNGEVAYALGIAEETVKNSLTAVYLKLGVQSRAAACYVLGRDDERRYQRERAATDRVIHGPEAAATRSDFV
jgi:DNA-binding CsgD family transcriptional regulator